MTGYKVTKLICDDHGIFSSQNLEIDGKNMLVEGKAGKGKTTLISLLEKIINKKPNIKMGASKETLQAFLKNDEGETLFLKRTNTEKGKSTPVFIDDNGEEVSSADIKKMFSDLSQNPLGLLQKKGQERFEFILKCSNVDIKKFNKLKVDRTIKADERKQAKTHTEYLLNRRGENPGNEKRVDISIKQKVLDGAYSHNREIEKAEVGRDYLLSSLDDKKILLEKLQLEISSIEESLNRADEWFEDNKKDDTEELQKEIQAATETNEKADTYDRWIDKNKEYSEENQKWCALDDDVKNLDNEIKSMTDGIEFPLDGVAVNGSEIFYNDINYDSLGTSEQILISSCLVAKFIVSQKKSINLMVIDRAESMDIETQAKVIEACNKIGVQIFLSIVDRKTDAETFKVDYLEFNQ